MKRSKSIRLVLLGSLSTAVFTGCSQKPSISTQNVYTNNFFVPGVGYYHAPFRNWYPQPYNYQDPGDHLYFYGGQWGHEPFESITNISSPTPESVQYAEAKRTDISRGGFGGYPGGYYGGGGYHSGSSWGFHS